MEAKRSSLDIINSLPQNIVETVFYRLKRQSVLSKKWRYSWTTIPRLEFYEKSMFNKSSDGNQPNDRKDLTKSCKVFYAIYQVLLLHQAPIHEMNTSQLISHLMMSSIALAMSLFKCLPMIEHLNLSRSFLKDLAKNGVPRELPTTLVNLKYLNLRHMPQILSFVGLLMRSSPRHFR